MKQNQALFRGLSVAAFLFGLIFFALGVIAMTGADGDGVLFVIGVFLLIAGACDVGAMILAWKRKAPPVPAEDPAAPGSRARADGSADYKAEYLRYMDERGVRYRDVDERRVDVSYTGNNAETLLIRVIFDADGSGHVHFICSDVGSFKDRVPEGLLLCNAMNMNYRWAKFFLNQENSVIVDADAVIDGNIVGPSCVEIVERLVDITDKAYPEFMKVKWGQPED